MRHFNVRHHTRYLNIRYHTRYFNVRHHTRYFNIKQFQRVQNSAARLVLKKRKENHVTPLLKELHWLPVKCRCEYNMAAFFLWRHFDSTLPSYVSALHTSNVTRPPIHMREAFKSSEPKVGIFSGVAVTLCPNSLCVYSV